MSATKRRPPQQQCNNSRPNTHSVILPSPPKRPRTETVPGHPYPRSEAFDLSLNLYVSGLYVHFLLCHFTDNLVPRLMSKDGRALLLNPQMAHSFVWTFLHSEWEKGKIPLLLPSHCPPTPLSAQSLGSETGKELSAAGCALDRCQDGTPDKDLRGSVLPTSGPSSPLVGNVNAECYNLLDGKDQKDESATALRLNSVSCSDKSTQTEDGAVKMGSKNMCVFCGNQSCENCLLTVTSWKEVELPQFVPHITANTKLTHGLENTSVESVVKDTQLERARFGPVDTAEKFCDACVKVDAIVPGYSGDVATARPTQAATNRIQTSGDKKKPAEGTRPTRRSNLIQQTGSDCIEASDRQIDHQATFDVQAGGNVSSTGEIQTTNHSGCISLVDTEPGHGAFAGYADTAKQWLDRVHPVSVSDTHGNSLQVGEDSAQMIVAQAGQDVADCQNKQANNRPGLPVLTEVTTGQSMSLPAGANQQQSSQHFGTPLNCLIHEKSPVNPPYRAGVSNLQRLGHCPRTAPWIAGRFVHHSPHRFSNTSNGQNHPRFLRSASNPQTDPRFQENVSNSETGPGLNKYLLNCEQTDPRQHNISSLLTSRRPLGGDPRLGGGIQPTPIRPWITNPQNNPRLGGPVQIKLGQGPGEGQLTEPKSGPLLQGPGGNPAQRVCVVPPSLGKNSATTPGMAVPIRPSPCDQLAKSDQQPASGSEGLLTVGELTGKHPEDNLFQQAETHVEHSANKVSATLVIANNDELGANQTSHSTPFQGLSNMQDADLSIGDMAVNNRAGVVMSVSPQCGGNTQDCVQAGNTCAVAKHSEPLAGGGVWNPDGFSGSRSTSLQTPAGTLDGNVAPDGIINRSASTGNVQQCHLAAKHLASASLLNDCELNPEFHQGVSERQQRNSAGDGCMARDQALPVAGTAMFVGEQAHRSKGPKVDRTAGRMTGELAVMTSEDENRAYCLKDSKQVVENDLLQNQFSKCITTRSEPVTYNVFDTRLSSNCFTPQMSVSSRLSTASFCHSTETHEKQKDSRVSSDSTRRHPDNMSFDRSAKRLGDFQPSVDRCEHTNSGSCVEVRTDHKHSSKSGRCANIGKHTEKQSSEIRAMKSDAETISQAPHSQDEPQTTSGQIKKIVGQIQLMVGQLYGDKSFKSAQLPTTSGLSRLSSDRASCEQLKEKMGSTSSNSSSSSSSSGQTRKLLTAKQEKPLSKNKASMQIQHTSTVDKCHQDIVTEMFDTRTRWTMTTPLVRVNRRLMTDLPLMSNAATWTGRIGNREASTQTDRWPTKDRWTLTHSHWSVISRTCQTALPKHRHVETCTEPSPACVKTDRATMTCSMRCHQATMTEETLCASQKKLSQCAKTQTVVGEEAGSENQVAVRGGEITGATEGTVKITIRLKMGSRCQARLLGPQ